MPTCYGLTPRALRWRLVLLFSAATLLFSCSDDTTDGGSQCPEGTQLNQISGSCDPIVRGDFDSGTDDTGEPSDTDEEADADPPDDTGSADVGPDAQTEDTSSDAPCSELERRCQNGNVETCYSGQFQLTDECSDDEICERGNCIPDGVSCQPGESRCVSPTAYAVCESDGSSFGDPVSCGQGESCDGGECSSGCNGVLNEKSNLGCEYVSMRLNQANGLQTLPHTVVVSNPGDQPATVSVTSPGISNFSMPDQTIQPQQSAIIDFPTSPMIDQAGVSNQIYILNTSLPVIATQFAPLNNPGAGSETSDASLLLPTNVLGTEHIVLGWQGPPGFGGFQSAGTYIDVVAMQDNTTIQVSGPKALSAGSLGSMAANSSQSFSIPRNHVLHLAENGGITSSGTDLSGTVITSNKPVAVYTGATLVNIPDQPIISNPPSSCVQTGSPCTYNADCCTGICGHPYQNGNEVAWECMDSLSAGDHVEQQLFPTDTWGTSYVATPFYNRGVNDFSIYKVTAANDNTTVSIDPPVNGVSSMTLDRGEVRQFHTPDAFEMNASAPIMVAQFMIGGTNSPSGDGDPAFLLPPAVQQFRDSYVFLVPDQYAMNFVTLIAPSGTDVQLDGTTHAASTFTQVGGQSGWAYKLVDSLAGGVHTASANQNFGIVVHGMDNYISYAFSGGIILPN
ncbi:hypothetical protein FIV42_20620 [Persicimonas caeni]|uniref:IgGFc-binding protein N-terminal domain-containing protein n=1 Tax=Persicimonas caeni TaxID=2292766 RepID=A0A4Y6PY25_PERCE|nr:hypothetical protein [Persicimonas caeni]QDG53059.1 hypothetical protein FIV42_20620 [Persicimonas caeni]QED34281.1 hypothetical protein FRD00_20615 [Persicimonas caeni]